MLTGNHNDCMEILQQARVPMDICHTIPWKAQDAIAIVCDTLERRDHTFSTITRFTSQRKVTLVKHNHPSHEYDHDRLRIWHCGAIQAPSVTSAEKLLAAYVPTVIHTTRHENFFIFYTIYNADLEEMILALHLKRSYSDALHIKIFLPVPAFLDTPQAANKIRNTKLIDNSEVHEYIAHIHFP